MQKVLNYLKDLQELDSQLAQLESLRGDLPQQVNRLKKELKNKQDDLTSIEEQLRNYQTEKGTAEIDIKSLDEKEKQYQSQLFEVKNNREYDAVTHEIETVKSSIGEKEGRILELMDLEEAAKQSLEEGKQALDQLSSELEKTQKELDKKLAQTEKDELALKHEKEKIIRAMDNRTFAAYDRIRKNKAGVAVVPVIRNACGGCFKSLPPQRILEIRQMDRIKLCEVCGRILVWDEEKAEG